MRLPLLAALLLPAIASAEVYFDENFEPGNAYTLDGPIPSGYGMIHHGCWRDLGAAFQTGIVIAEGDRQAVKLSHTRDKKGARIIGSFGINAQENTRVQSPLRIRLSFKYRGPLDESFFIMIYGGDGKSRATVGANAAGQLYASFGGVREELAGQVNPDQWYLLEFLLPGNPTNKSRWTVNLYESNGETMIDSRQGVIARSIEQNGGNYSAIDIQIRNPDTVLILDDIKVETRDTP